ncbi:flavodoxin domain-containing protein (plasmid) [Rhizobium sp. YTU87027]
MAADDIAEFIRENGEEAQVIPMEDCDVSRLQDAGLVIVITSTYGEGELPETTQPFYDALRASRPDLGALKFGAFGLGDSTYETYGNGIDVVSTLLNELGAHQVGETGRHDAAKGVPLSQAALDWVDRLLPSLSRRAA